MLRFQNNNFSRSDLCSNPYYNKSKIANLDSQFSHNSSNIIIPSTQVNNSKSNTSLSASDFKKNLVLVTMKYEKGGNTPSPFQHSYRSETADLSDNNSFDIQQKDYPEIPISSLTSDSSSEKGSFFSCEAKFHDIITPVPKESDSPKNSMCIVPVSSVYHTPPISSTNLLPTYSEYPLLLSNHKDSRVDAEDIMIQTIRKRARNSVAVYLFLYFFLFD
jgi:hypothetical protein